MRALIIADELFARRENAMLARLEVGMTGEGVRVVQAIPERGLPPAAADAFSQAVTYADTGMPFTLSLRAARVVSAVRSLGDGEGGIDVVHVLGGSAWPLGVQVARRFEAPLALEVWRGGLVGRARRLGATPGVRTAFFAPDREIERELHSAGFASRTPLIPWGVHLPAAPNDVLSPDRAPTIMLAGAGRDTRAFAAAFDAIIQLMRRREGLMLFADAEGVQRAGVWHVAREQGMLKSVSLLDDMDAHRELVLRGDFLVQPDARGEHRTIFLDAMAHGMAVVAARDPLLGWLIDGQTARLVDPHDARAWETALGALLDDPASARALGASARQYVREHHRASSQIVAVLAAYEALRTPEAIPFDERAGAVR